MHTAVWTILTFLIAAGGGLAMHALDMPAGLLMGGALAVSIAALMGFKAEVPNRVRDVFFIAVGLSMGANVAPDTLSLMGQWPITLAALALELVIIVYVCGFMLIKMFGLDRGTAYLSSFPGHLSFIMGIATAGAGDPRQIVIIQVLRVMVLTLCVPIGALFLPVGTYGGNGAQEMMAPTTLVMVAIGCAITGFIFSRLRMPAGYVLGSMGFATAMKLTGNFDGQLPPILVDITFIGMGALIGSRFAGIRRDEFFKAIIAGLLSTGITIAIVTVMAWGLAFIVDMPFGQLWLGLSPGGLESMGALGIALGYDTAFIAAHHVSRLMMLTFAIPAVVLLLNRRERKERAQ